MKFYQQEDEKYRIIHHPTTPPHLVYSKAPLNGSGNKVELRQE